MSPFQLGAALVTLAAALVALSAREIRLSLAGLVVSLACATLVADPLPSPLAVLVRLVAALLGAQLVLVALRGRRTAMAAAPLGLPSALLAACAAFVVGYATSGVGSPAAGPAEATAVGFALAVLAIGPLLLGRDIVRVGLGLALFVTAIELVRTGLSGTPGALEQVIYAGLTVATLGVTSTVAQLAIVAGHEPSLAGEAGWTTLFEAHRLAAPAALPAAGPSGSGPGRGRGRPGRIRPRTDAHQLTIEERLGRAESGRAESDAPAPTSPADPGSPVEPAGPGPGARQ
ncbi:MAG: hypothetical protein ACRDGQ_03410 [Candidatus Limnocylindrales bacterium]